VPTTKEARKNCKERIAIECLVEKVRKGEIPPDESHAVWEKIYSYKDAYRKSIGAGGSQSWNSYVGGVFERLVYYILKNYVVQVSKKPEFANFSLFTEDEIIANDFLHQKLSIRYGKKERVLPDVDMAIVDYYAFNPAKSVIVAIISCKTSLRERIAQACYWKLKLISADTTKHIQVFLATSDNDKDFDIGDKGERSRDRIIAEYELDGVYILKGDFKQQWESKKVKQYDKIFEDLVNIFKDLKRSD
jgi:type II restriction enzyme